MDKNIGKFDGKGRKSNYILMILFLFLSYFEKIDPCFDPICKTHQNKNVILS